MTVISASSATKHTDRHGNIYYSVTLNGDPIGTVWKVAGGRWKAEHPAGGFSPIKKSLTQAVETLEFWARLRGEGAAR
jgi:hypothetical protein